MFRDAPAGVSLYLIDRDGSDQCVITGNLQIYFCNHVRSTETACGVNLNGSCTTMVVLVIWMCLRLGCRDPQKMVDAIRNELLKHGTEAEGVQRLQEFHLCLCIAACKVHTSFCGCGHGIIDMKTPR